MLEEKDIDGLRVLCTPLDVWTASKLMAKIAAISGEAIVHIGVAIARGSRIEDLDVDAIAPQLASAFGKLDDETHDLMILRSLAGTEVVRDGTKYTCQSIDKIKAAFAGKVWTLWKAVWFAWVVNFRGFSLGGSNSDSPVAGAA